MPKHLHHDRMMMLFAKALAGGAQRKSLSSATWALHGDCLEPFTTSYVGRPREYEGGDPSKPRKLFVYQGVKMSMYLDISTRCRKCEKCRKARSSQWRHRVREELRRGARNWWGTLTLSPESHHRMMATARLKTATRSVTWEELSPDERWKRVVDASLIEVTKYLKRVRKAAKVPFRYVLVTERHKSGLPHFHLCIHESEFKTIPHRILSGQWNGKNFALGFEKWRLIPFDDYGRHAGYVTKYISKDLTGKVRASQHYGEPPGQATVGAAVRVIRDHLSGSEQSEA